ncbi:MAG TPA: hypothetical protein VG841_05740 [Caulobacterales bacterium]|nr:hypothetical protein [Caulobacterales bacterium]
MKAGFTAAALTAALVVCACGALVAKYPNFQAGAAYRLEGLAASPNGGPSLRTVIYRDGPRMRVETDIPAHGRAAIVFDEPSHAPYVLDPVGSPWAQALAADAPTQPINANAGVVTMVAPPPAAVVTPPPRALGVAVRVADADAPQALETYWAALGPDRARAAGPCTAAGERGVEWRPRDGAARRSACITSDGIVLLLREDKRVLFRATSLVRGRQDSRLFGVPVGYRKLDPNHVAPAQEASNGP